MKICFIAPHTRPSGGVRRMHMLAKLLKEDYGHDTRLVWGGGTRQRWIDEGVSARWYAKSVPAADVYVSYEDAPNQDLIEQLPGKKVLLFLGYLEEESTALQQPFDGIMTISDWLTEEALAAGHKNVYKIGVGLEPFFHPPRDPAPGRVVGTLVREPDANKDSTMTCEAIVSAQTELLLATLTTITYGDKKVEGASIHYHKPTREMIPFIYRQCGIWLVDSKREGFGMPGLEALASGCALVTMDTLGSREYARHEETAIIVKDSAEMAMAISRLVNDDNARRALAANGVEESRKFTWLKAAMRAEAFLRQICES